MKTETIVRQSVPELVLKDGMVIDKRVYAIPYFNPATGERLLDPILWHIMQLTWVLGQGINERVCELMLDGVREISVTRKLDWERQSPDEFTLKMIAILKWGKDEVTQRNLDYLSAFATLVNRGNRHPSSRDIAKWLNCAKSTVDYHIDILAKAGFLHKIAFTRGTTHITEKGWEALE